jgi:hypothetical protein
MITRALAIKLATTVGLTCSVAVPTTISVTRQHDSAVRHRAAVAHKRDAPAKLPARVAVPACPPSGIATIGALPDLSRSLVAMDSDFEDAVLSGSTTQSAARSPWGGAVQAALIGFVRPGGAGGVGTAPPAGGTPVATPTDETPVSALPEPKTWLFMIAGMLLIGGTLRRRRASPKIGVIA